eukprot:213561-Amphidinium_carterae.1
MLVFRIISPLVVSLLEVCSCDLGGSASVSGPHALLMYAVIIFAGGSDKETYLGMRMFKKYFTENRYMNTKGTLLNMQSRRTVAQQKPTQNGKTLSHFHVNGSEQFAWKFTIDGYLLRLFGTVPL